MIFTLKLPLLGFEHLSMMKLEKIDDTFAKLSSQDADNISFTLINPFILCDYNFEIPTPLQTLMEIDDNSDLLIYNMMIVNSELEKSTINLAAPLIFNVTNQTMAQLILQDSTTYGIAHKLSTFLEAS
jgi:flagellar assembly factor FliW